MDNKQLVTVAHLQVFKEELIKDFKVLLKSGGRAQEKQWMKSREVRKLLDISPGTLQTMRKNRTIVFKKVGGTIYYDRNKVNAMLDGEEA